MSSGPFVIDEEGSKSDAGIWEADMDADAEARMEKYNMLMLVKYAAEQELTKRGIPFGKNKKKLSLDDF